MSFDASAIKAAAKAISAVFPPGLPLSHAQSFEIAAATVGFYTYKLLRDYDTPVVLFKDRDFDRRMPLNMYMARATERIRDVMGLSEFQAMDLAAKAIGAVRALGLQVDGTAVALDARFERMRLRIFAAMTDAPHLPTQASVAIGRKILPDIHGDLRSRLQMLAEAPGFLEKVVRSEHFLWMEPDQKLAQCAAAYCDNVGVVQDTVQSGELGLRICVVVPFEAVGNPAGTDYSIKPVIAFAHRESAWRVDLNMQNAMREPVRLRQGQAPLAEIIGMPVRELPRLRVCKHCLALHCEEVEELRHACDQGQISARDVFVGLLPFSQSQQPFSFATLAAGMEDDGLPSTRSGRWSEEALAKFVSDRRIAFRVRPIQDGWIANRETALERYVS